MKDLQRVASGVVHECPSCGDQVFRAMYVPDPEHLDPDRPRPRLPLDAAPLHPDDPYASHAASAGRTKCRRLTRDHPLEASETAHVIHYATHPACRPAGPTMPGAAALRGDAR